MQLSISAFTGDAPIPARFTCDGDNVSPALEWSDPPAGTRSYALVVDDPDAPGGVFRHWGAYNIDASAKGLDEGAGNRADTPFRQARNDFRRQGYGGPCPPRGDGAHRYRFTLMALDVSHLAVGASSGIEDLERSARGHVLAQATVTATYERN
ncbi:MAG: YbhB/YbcL family Raf kinase inhibitor-like protein [Proteobacteria bacterium]|nr:YbhB/YbcL family Raf kinase inhibitor-like protein [Pseudomonadota bacterium]